MRSWLCLLSLWCLLVVLIPQTKADATPSACSDFEEMADEKKDAEFVTQSDAIKAAYKNSLKLDTGNKYSLLQKMALTARILADEGHGGTLSGQVTCRQFPEGGDEDGVYMMTGLYGRSFDETVPEDFVLVDDKLKVMNGGEGHPNMATRFHIHVYRKRPDISCLIHTHPPSVSVLAQLGVPLFISHMDFMALYEDTQYLKHWPGVPFGDEEGEIISGVLGDHWSGLLAHHGLIVGGRTLEEATYRAFFMERAAKAQLALMSANGGTLDGLPRVEPEIARVARDWRISDGPVKAHYASWARMVIQKYGLKFV